MSGLEGLLTGRTLADRYRIEEVIGRGGMAAVFRASDEVLARTVAVKVISGAAPDEAAREQARARFQREARALARLQHPNVVTVFDFGLDAELQLDFLVMELLEGEDLASRLSREGRLEPALALRILREAAAGVEAGHRAGLIHRDVKPGNLFLAAKGPADAFRVCVLDFGIARIVTGDDPLTSLTRGHTPLSPAYASPEQLLGDAPLTPASDVYSLGVVAYQLLTGSRLDQGRGLARSPDQVPSIRAAHPEVPRAVADVVERALQPVPEHRFPDAGALGEALDRAMAAPDAADAVPPIPPHYHARRHARLPDQPVHAVPSSGKRSGASRAVLGGILMVALLLAGWWVVGDGGASSAPRGEGLAQRSPTGSPAPAGASDQADDLARELDAVLSPEQRTTSAAGDAPRVAAETSAGGPTGSPAGPPEAEALHDQGLRLFERGDYGAAVEHFRRAAALAPRNAHYLNNLGWALFRAGDLDAAEAELNRVVRLDPRRDIVHANLGELHLARNDTASAIASYQRFLQLNSDPRREQIARAKLALLRGG